MVKVAEGIKGLPKGDTKWFTHDRFGMFIHWGLYAQGARHEWLMHHESIPVEEYERRYFKRFDPDLYNPKVWAKAAANAGMKYFVVTTKHHEGFCLWDSKHTDYKATNTAAGRDLLRPMVEAFREEGIKVGFYYSLIDWHHPQMIIDNKIGPYRGLSAEKIAEMNKGRDQKKYAKYMRDQVTELLTDFGEVDVLWFDFSYPDKENPGDFEKGKGHLAWESEKLYKLVRKLSPNVVVDNRLDLAGAWDIMTPEQFQPREWVTVDGERVVWEACQTFSGSWGYHRSESDWRDSGQLIRTLIDSTSKGGNLLLNVGPTGRGEFDDRALERLSGIGEWMKRHSRSIYGCTEAPAGVVPGNDCRLTYNPETNRLYVHVFAWPYMQLYVDGLGDRVEYAQFLHDASELSVGLDDWRAGQPGSAESKGAGTCVINLPQKKPAVEVPVIELFLK
ncbi:MAG: alpha-L-fucosidase [Lentisphaerae bacterium]|jgi:alpha-L-fucosidase|nr:alpha-L-fucosidase [Lentisphaerota bacterium]